MSMIEKTAVTLTRRALSRALQHATAPIEARNTIPILSNVRLRAGGGAIEITGTDMDIEAKVTVPCDGTLCCTVAGRPLARALKALRGDDVTLSLNETGAALKVQSGNAVMWLSCLPVEDSPDNMSLPEADWSWHATLGQEPKDAWARCRPSISREETRYYLNGINFSQDGGVYRFVSTDGHRLTCCAFPLPDADESPPPPVIIPRKAVTLAMALWGKEPVRLSLNSSGTRARLAFGDTVLTLKPIDGTFPDYARIIPQEFEGYIKVRRREILEALGITAALYFGYPSRGSLAIKLTCDPRMVAETPALLAISGETVEAGSVLIECPHDGLLPERIVFGVNGRYLETAMRQLGAVDFVLVRLSGPGAPMLIESPELEGVRIVLMPMRV